MPEIQVCAFHADEGVFGEPLGDEVGAVRYTCTRTKGHPSPGPWSWVFVPAPPGLPGVSGLAADLGLHVELPAVLGEFRGSWVEYGVVEQRYALRNPNDFTSLVERYGHTAIAAKSYTASAFLAHTLGDLSRTGTVLWHAGPATGRWAYNSSISWWALPPEPEWSTACSWAALECDVRYVPGQVEQ